MMIIGVWMLEGWTGIQAQPPGGKCAERGAGLLRYLKDSVGITAEQELRISRIQDSTCMHVQALMKQHGGNKEQAKPELERTRREGMEKIKAVLTEEQRARLRSKRQERNRNYGIPPGL
jgi:hypothetical protein